MDDKQDSEKLHKDGADLSRRDFLALSVAAGLAAATGSTLAAAQQVVETDVTIKMPDGTCDAAFIHPPSGSHPGVLIWADAFGLRPAMRDIGKRIAAEGYSVLVPNPFYRVAKAPVFDNPSSFDFQNQADMAKLKPLMASVNAPGAAEKDAVAYIAFLDAQSQINKAKKIKARMYFAIASNDDQRQPDAKDKLREAFAAAKVPAEIEVYPARHGWCVPDMPTENGAPIYNRPEAERAWSKLVALYKMALA